MAAAPSRRVAWVDHCAQLGGGEIALATLLQARPEGALVVLAEHGPLVERLERAGVEVQVLPLDERARGAARTSRIDLGQVWLVLRYVVRLARLLRRERVDLVHTNSLKAGLYGCAAARLARVPSVWHLRDGLHEGYLPRRLVPVLRRTVRWLPQLLVANSAWTLRTSGLAPDRCPVVLSPVELSSRPAQEHAGTVVTLLGRVSPTKGQREFLTAFALAFAATPEVRGRVVGSALFGEDDYAAGLPVLARELGIDDRISFEPFTDDVAGVLAGTDVLVHCSPVPEPFGQVVVQGMAAGLGVVAAALGGPAEVVTDGYDGLLADPRDSAALAAAMARLVGDPELRARLGAQARTTAEAYRVDRVWAQVDAAHDRVLRTSR